MNKKIITGVTAATLVATNVMPATKVLATESMDTDANIQDSLTSTDELSKLEQAVLDAKEVVEQKSKVVENLTKQVDEMTHKVASLQQEYDKEKTQLDALENRLNADIVDVYNQQKNMVATLQQSLHVLNEEKEALDNKRIELQMNLDAVKELLEQAEEALAEAKISHEALGYTEESLQQAQHDVLDAEDNLVTAKEYVEDMKQMKDKTFERFTQASVALEQVEATHAQNKKVLDQAKVSAQTKKDLVDETKQALDAFDDTEVLDSAKKAYEQASEALNEANSTLNEKNNSLKQAKQTYDASVVAYNQAKEKVESAQEQINLAEQALQVHVEKLQQATESLQIATNQRNQVTKDKTELQNSIETKKSKVKSLKETDLVQLQNAEQDALNAVKADEEAVKKAQDAVNKGVIDKSKLGSKGFFEQVNATHALEILDDAVKNHRYEGKPTTIIGDEYDATNLNSMKIAINYLKQFNELRKSIGLPELLVSHDMMAVAQVQANMSKYTMNHSHLHQPGENLAMLGEDMNPFDGWYTQEKAYFEEFVAKTPELQELKNGGMSDFDICIEISENYPQEWNKVGHYANIISPYYQITGYAYSFMDLEYYEQATHSQTFFVNDDGYDEDGVMTVSEYEALFNQYAESIDTTTSKEQLNQQLQNAKDRLSKSQQVLVDIQQQIEVKQKEIQKLENEVVSMKQNLEAMISQESTLNETVLTLTGTVSTMQKQKENLEEDVRIAKAHKQELINTKELEQAKIEMESLATVVKKVQGEQVQAKASVDLAEKVKAEKYDALTKLQESMKQDKEKVLAEYERAKTDYDTCMLEVARLEGLYAESQLRVDEAVALKEATNIRYTEAIEVYEDAQFMLVDTQSILTERTEYKQRIEAALEHEAQLQQRIDEIEAGQKNWPIQLEEIIKNISTKQSEINQLEQTLIKKEEMLVNYAQAKDVWESVIAGGMDTLENDDLKSIATGIEEYKELRGQVVNKVHALESQKVVLADLESILKNAKDEHRDATAILDEATKAWNAHLDSLKPQQDVKPSTDPKPESTQTPNQKPQGELGHNKPISNKEEPMSPQTADSSKMGLFATLLAMSGFGLALARRKKELSE